MPSTLSFSQEPSARHRILLLEDDESIREAFAELLEYEGYELCATGEGEEALEVLGRSPLPHVILLDMMMPTMDGHEFLRRLAQLPACAQIPVVVVSATQQERPPGVVAFIRKPFEPRTLIDLLRHLLKGSG